MTSQIVIRRTHLSPLGPTFAKVALAKRKIGTLLTIPLALNFHRLFVRK